MKKCKPLFAILCIAAILALSIHAYAHPGKTDSSGGHTDHSSGDYHYHHGYSAHDHYDMDGDGNIDCPYDFKDNTNHDSSDSDNGSYDANSSNAQTSNLSGSTCSLWNDIVAFLCTPYGIFCIIAVILQIVFTIILSRARLDSDVFLILLLCIIILCCASYRVSCVIILVCAFLLCLGGLVVFLIYAIFALLHFCFSIIWNGVKSVIRFLFSKS